MEIGITGSRKGLSPLQTTQFYQFIIKYGRPEMLHHGCCIGVDEGIDWICRDQGIPMHYHPSSNTKFSQFKFEIRPLDALSEAAPALERNKHIVDMSDMMFAFPHGKEYLRSGTWACVIYAKKVEVPLIITYPDGRMEEWHLS